MKKENISSIGTIMTSLLATSCCVGPAIFIVTGTSVGFLSQLSFLEPVTPYMLVIAFLMLGYSFWKLYLKKPDCDCDQDVRTRKIARTIFWVGFTSLLIATSLGCYMDIWLRRANMIKKIIITAVALLFISGYYAIAAEQNIIMEIEGLTCPLCPIAVKKALSNVDGVRDVTVSLDDEKALLIVQDSVTDETLSDAVKKVGSYKGKVIQRTVIE